MDFRKPAVWLFPDEVSNGRIFSSHPASGYLFFGLPDTCPGSPARYRDAFPIPACRRCFAGNYSYSRKSGGHSPRRCRQGFGQLLGWARSKPPQRRVRLFGRTTPLWLPSGLALLSQSTRPTVRFVLSGGNDFPPVPAPGRWSRPANRPAAKLRASGSPWTKPVPLSEFRSWLWLRRGRRQRTKISLSRKRHTGQFQAGYFQRILNSRAGRFRERSGRRTDPACGRGRTAR